MTKPYKQRMPFYVEPLGRPPTQKEQAAIRPCDVLPTVDAVGKLPKGLAEFMFGDPQEYFFQRDGGKNCLTRFNNGPYEKTPARLAQQERYRQGVAAWNALSDLEKCQYIQNPNAHSFRLPGYQYFMKLWLQGKIGP